MANSTSLYRRFADIVGPIWRNCLLGGFSFWSLNVTYHLLGRREPSGAIILLLTLGMPVTAGLAYTAVRACSRIHDRSVALSMLLGIWLMGPTMIELGQTFRGGGFRNFSVGVDLIIAVACALVPIYTLILAGYDLSIISLLLVTVGLIVLHLKCERGTGLFRSKDRSRQILPNHLAGSADP